MKQIDERGNACPIPVVHTKKALESMGGETKLMSQPFRTSQDLQKVKTVKSKVRRFQTMNLRLRSW